MTKLINIGLLILLTIPLSLSAQQKLDTLFFSPAQRDILDRARRGEPERGLAPVEVRNPTINGYVQRSDGKAIVWVDGKAHYDAQGRSVMNLQASDVANAASGVTVTRNAHGIAITRAPAESGSALPTQSARKPSGPSASPKPTAQPNTSANQ